MGIDSGAAGVTYECPADYYRAIYLEFIDCATSCISDRFDQETFGVYENAESFLINTINCKEGEPADMAQRLNDVTKHFTTDLDSVRLKSQLSILAGSVPDEHGVLQPLIPHLTSLPDLISEMKGLGKGRLFYADINNLIHLLLTIPVSSATAERSFSALRRLKTFTRSTMTASRLNNIAVLHVHQERTDSLVDDEIIQEFVAGVGIRELTFGTN